MASSLWSGSFMLSDAIKLVVINAQWGGKRVTGGSIALFGLVEKATFLWHTIFALPAAIVLCYCGDAANTISCVCLDGEPTMKNIICFRVPVMACAISASLALSAIKSNAQSNLVANGSFEAGPAGINQFTDWGWFGPADSFSDYGVAKSTVSPDVAEQGSYYAFFRGHPTDDSQDCLGTTVDLKTGAIYHISYYLGTDGSTLNTGAAMWVVIGTSFGIDLSQDILLTKFTPSSSNSLPYQELTTTWPRRLRRFCHFTGSTPPTVWRRPMQSCWTTSQ